MAQQNTSEEIDLGYLFKKSNDFIKKIVRGLFQILDFFKRYFIIVIVLIILGFAYGYYKDATSKKTYINEALVIPNFESVDYLYDKVEVINNKISRNDTLYLKQILDTNFRKLKNIKIEPIADIYNFVSKSRRNFDVLRLIAEKQDFSEYIEDLSTSKYFKYHRMKIAVSGDRSSEKIVADLFTYLNGNENLEAYQKVFVENNKFEIKEHYNMIAQIDSILKASAKIDDRASNVTINNSSDLFNLIEKKTELLENIVQLKTQEIDFSAPIKVVSTDYNLEIKRFLSISNKVKYPILFVFLFSMVFLVLYIVKSLKRYAKAD